MVDYIEQHIKRIDPDELVLEEPDDFRVHQRVYTDPDIFRLEMRQLFGATWVYVAHESEVAQPGDFKTAYIGLQPVIVSRHTDGTLHVLFNRCTHRGAVVCREAQGNCEYFQCLYHGWVFNTRGDLTGIAQRSGYPPDFPQDRMGLQPVPRVATYRGLIFASLNPAIISLAEYLGPVTECLDFIMDASPTGTIDLCHGVNKYDYAGNWKFQCENTVDGYHGNYVHRSLQEVTARTRDTAVLGRLRGSGNSLKDQVTYRERGGTRGFPHGHSALERPFVQEQLDTLQAGPFGDYYRQLEAQHGTEHLLHILGGHNTAVFPNLYFVANHLRVVQPINEALTEVYTYPFKLVGAPEALNVQRLRAHEQFYGPGGFGVPDDMEAFLACQSGMYAEGVPWVNLSRGLYRERVDEQDIRYGHSTDETPQRAFHREWKRLMQTNGDDEIG